MQSKCKTGLTGNQLKVIAAVCMVIDHVGVALFPQNIGFRVIGRIAFPIFSYFIYEGCRYTHNYIRYWVRIFGLGIVCAIGYFIYCGEFYGNVLFTFSGSIGILYALRWFKENQSENNPSKRLRNIFLLLGCVLMIYVLSVWLQVDYGFGGVILPVFAELTRGLMPDPTKDKYVTLIGFGIGLLLLSMQMGGIQMFSLLTLPLLAAYNGQKGKNVLKYGFYWFYPLHLAAIGMVAMAIQ